MTHVGRRVKHFLLTRLKVVVADLHRSLMD